MNSKQSAFLCRIRLLVKHIQIRTYRRILGLILLALLGLTTTLSIPVLSAQEFGRTAETITQTSDAQSLLQQGIELYEGERFSEAAAIWQQANTAFASQGDNLGQALVLSNLSSTYQHLGQWEEAQRYIEKSLKELKTSQDTAHSQTHREILAKA